MLGAVSVKVHSFICLNMLLQFTLALASLFSLSFARAIVHQPTITLLVRDYAYDPIFSGDPEFTYSDAYSDLESFDDPVEPQYMPESPYAPEPLQLPNIIPPQPVPQIPYTPAQSVSQPPYIPP